MKVTNALNVSKFAFHSVLITTSDEQSVCLRSGRPNPAKSEIAQVFPNPTTGNLTIDYSVEHANTVMQIQVYAVTGVLLQQFETLCHPGEHKEILQLRGDLPKGVLMVKIRIGNQHYNKLIVKQ